MLGGSIFKMTIIQCHSGGTLLFVSSTFAINGLDPIDGLSKI